MLEKTQFREEAGKCRKLDNKYDGPYVVTTIVDTNNVTISAPDRRFKSNTFNVKKKKKYCPIDYDSEQDDEEQTDEFEATDAQQSEDTVYKDKCQAQEP